MDYMKFITDNYIWFLVAGIVLLMTVIGYFAEKTEFGKKSHNKEPKKKIKNNNALKEEIAMIDPTTEISSVETSQDNKFNEQNVDMTEAPMENLDPIDLELPVNADEEHKSYTEELLKSMEEIPATVASEEKPIEEIFPQEESLKDENIPEELYVGLDGTPNSFKKEEEVELPKLDSLEDKTDSNHVDSVFPDDEDMWKF